MRKVDPDTRFLLLGLAERDAATVGRRLREAGATVDLVCQGPCGRSFVRNHVYDVVLVTLPTRRTAALADLAFYRQHAAEAGILAVVPLRESGQIPLILDGGADDCVTVPFEVEELLARLRALARRVRANRSKEMVLQTHDLEINTVTRIVRRDGRVIPLTTREYAFLQLLALHCGRIVSRSRIWEHLYGGTRDMTSNVIDVYIRNLRSKVDKGFELPLILTRWGQGYQLRGDADHDDVPPTHQEMPRQETVEDPP